MTLKVCPACSRRWAGVVAADCDVCAGTGIMTLGPAALHREGPDVTSRAVELALEAAARVALAAPDMTADSAHAALRAAVGHIRAGNLLARDTAGFSSPTIARAPLHPSVPQTLDAPPLIWTPDERPLAAGVPGFSTAGYISRMARAADPLDLFGASPSELAHARVTIERKAQYLAAAVASRI